MGMKCLWFPRTVLEADFLVAMPKTKGISWSGVTLSMRNMFGVVPGARCVWPKSILLLALLPQLLARRVLRTHRRLHTCDNVTKMGAGPEMTFSRRRAYSYRSALIGFPTWNPSESDQFMRRRFFIN